MKKSISIMACMILLPCMSLFSAVFHVSTVDAFQNALTTASANNESDSIYVAAGNYQVITTLTYFSSEQFSLVIYGAGAATTILNGNNMVQILSLNSTGDFGDLEVAHLHLTNGNSPLNGGGALVNTGTAAATVHHCAFLLNTAGEIGGGLAMTSYNGPLAVSYCEFSDNQCLNNDAGALFMGLDHGNLLLEYSNFFNNTVYGDDAGGCMLYSDQTGNATLHDNYFIANEAADGAGGSMVYLLGANSNILEFNNYYEDNLAALDGAGSWNRMPASGNIQFYNNTLISNVANEAGGGGCRIQIQEGNIEVMNNVFQENVSGTTVSVEGNGGGLWIDLSEGNAQVHHNMFASNYAYQNGGGASLLIQTGTCQFFRNVLHDNQAGNVAGALSFNTNNALFQEYNNTYYQNEAAAGGGGVYYYFDGVSLTDIFNNILWHNTPNAIDYSGASAVTVRYSDVSGGAGNPWFGLGCIDGDPLFEDPANSNFLLTWANYPINDPTKSPCIDTGDPASPTDPDGSVADMGAYYYGQSLGIAPCHQQASMRVNISPNPANNQTNIQLFLTKESETEITITNLQGQPVTSLFKGSLEPGEHHFQWRIQKQCPGVYLCRISGENTTIFRRIVVIK